MKLFLSIISLLTITTSVGFASEEAFMVDGETVTAADLLALESGSNSKSSQEFNRLEAIYNQGQVVTRIEAGMYTGRCSFSSESQPVNNMLMIENASISNPGGPLFPDMQPTYSAMYFLSTQRPANFFDTYNASVEEFINGALVNARSAYSTYSVALSSGGYTINTRSYNSISELRYSLAHSGNYYYRKAIDNNTEIRYCYYFRRIH